MAGREVYVNITVDTRRFNRSMSACLRRLLKGKYRWRRFFHMEYWRTWLSTIFRTKLYFSPKEPGTLLGKPMIITDDDMKFVGRRDITFGNWQ
jgi:hypothetical protein